MPAGRCVSTRVVQRLLPALALLVVHPPTGCKPERPSIEPTRNEGRTGERSSGSSGENVAARVGDVVITVDEVRRYIESLPVFVRLRFQSPEARRKFLEALVEFKALALEAQRLGYARDMTLIQALKSDAAARLLRDEVDSRVTSKDIAEEAIDGYYRTHPWLFHRPAQVSVRHILVKDADEARKVVLRARKLCSRQGLDPREEFAKLVRKYSVDQSTKGTGGDIGRFPRVGPGGPDVPAEVARAAEGLGRQFEVSDVVKAPDGYHVLFAWEFHQPVELTLDQAREEIVKTLVKERRRELRRRYVESLIDKADIEIHEDVVESLLKEAGTGPGKEG